MLICKQSHCKDKDNKMNVIVCGQWTQELPWSDLMKQVLFQGFSKALSESNTTIGLQDSETVNGKC